MTTPIGAVGSVPTPARDTSDDARLKKSAQGLEGVFVEQLFKAMRDTVPQGEGVVSGGTGEDMFTGLMDQRLAADTPTQWAHGLASAAYRQLKAAQHPTADPSPAAAATTATAPATPFTTPLK